MGYIRHHYFVRFAATLAVIFLLLSFDVYAQNIDSLLNLAEQSKDPQQKAEYFTDASQGYLKLEKFQLSELYLLKAGEIYGADTNTYNYNENLLSLSYVYLKQEMFGKAFSFASRANLLADKTQRKEISAKALMHLALALNEEGQNDDAHAFALQSAEIYKELGDSLQLAYVYNILGVIAKNMGKYDEARSYYYSSLDLRRKYGSTKDQLIVLGNMAILYKLSGAFDSSFLLFRQVANLAGKSSSTFYLAGNNFNLGELMLLQADTLEAIKYFDSCFMFSTAGGFSYLEKQCCEALSNLHFEQKKYEEAWRYNRIFKKLDDSLSKVQSNKKISELKLIQANQERQGTIEKLESRQVFYFRIFHISFIISLIAIIVLILFRSSRLTKAKKALKVSERRFRLLAENASEVIWSSDLNLNLTYINQSTQKLFGYEREERLKKSMSEVFSSVSVEVMKKELESNLHLYRKDPERLRPIIMELNGKHKDGYNVWVEVSAYFSFDESGKIIGLQGTARDVTQRKLAEIKMHKDLENLSQQDEELKAQNEELIMARDEVEKTAEQYFDLFENGPVGYLILDDNGVVTELNSTASTLIGKVKEQVLDKPFIDFLNDADAPHFSNKLHSTLRLKTPQQDELRMAGLHVKVVLAPELISGKQKCQLALVDVSNEVTTREKLSVALNSLQTMFDAIPGGIIVVDTNHNIVNMNNRMMKLHNISSRSDAIGKKCFDVFECSDRPCVNCVLDKVISENKPVIRFPSKDDPVYKNGYYRIYSSPIYDNNGKPDGMVEVVMDISGQRKAEVALAESERKFEDLFNDIPDAVFITGIGEDSGKIIDINPAAELQTGYSREELLTMNMLTDISDKPIGRELTLEREKKLAENSKIELVERKRRKDGSLIWSEVVVQKIVIGGERYALSVSRNISDRVKIQEDLKRSESRVRSVLDALPDMLFVFDGEGNFLEYYAPNPEKLIMPPEKFLNKNINDIMPQYLANLTMAYIRETFATGKMQVYTYHVEDDRGISYFDARMVKATNNSVLTIVRDITESRKAEESRKQNEEKYKTIFRNTPLGIFNFNREGVILDCNEHFVKILGSSREALIGFRMLERLQNQKLKRVIEQAIIDGSGVFEGEYHSVTAKKVAHVRSFFKCIYNDNNEFVDGIGIVEDVSEQKEYEEKLVLAKSKAEESDRLKSSFMATMSHELRTPLNTVIGFSDMMEEELPADQVLEFAQIISKSGRNLLSIIEDILDISLIDSGDVKVLIEYFELNDLIEGLHNLAMQQQEAMNKMHLEVHIQYPEALKGVRLSGDVRKINKVFGHLIKNAFKFTRQGQIEIGVENPGESSNINDLLFFVKDTGIGIPKNKHKIIFEIFRQVDDSSTREFEGTGLGLSISKKLIEMMGGRIWLESKQEEGSIFYFQLPLKAGTAQTIERLNKYLKPKVKTMKGITVLVAEDDDTNFHLFKLLLNRRQIQVFRARNGEESIKLVESNPEIKLVLMDINMPVLNGYEATKKIKQLRSELPIVAVTAYAMAKDKARAEEAGCDDYITKPINNQIFYDTITKYLQ